MVFIFAFNSTLLITDFLSAISNGLVDYHYPNNKLFSKILPYIGWDVVFLYKGRI